jgi:hypothetical protein
MRTSFLSLAAATLLSAWAGRPARASCTPATLPTGIRITWLFPANGGPPGTPVILRGVGFARLPPGSQAVFFDRGGPFDGDAPITVVSDEEVRTTLPADAMTSSPRLTVMQVCTTIGGGRLAVRRTLALARDVLPVSDLPIRPSGESAVAVSDQEIRCAGGTSRATKTASASTSSTRRRTAGACQSTCPLAPPHIACAACRPRRTTSYLACMAAFTPAYPPLPGRGAAPRPPARGRTRPPC